MVLTILGIIGTGLTIWLWFLNRRPSKLEQNNDNIDKAVQSQSDKIKNWSNQ